MHVDTPAAAVVLGLVTLVVVGYARALFRR
jgi:hypothetical protein